MGVNQPHHGSAWEQAERLARSLHELVRNPEKEGQALKLAATIPIDDRLLFVICDGSHYTMPESRALIRCLARHHSTLDVRMLKLIAPDDKGVFSQDQFTFRVLELVAEITRGAHTMPLLLRMLRCASGRVLSKLVLLMGQVRKDSTVLIRHLESPDSRVRANVIEALWGNTNHDSMSRFRAACRDANHRVAINGWIGLHLANDRDAMAQIMRIAGHESALWRAAAAWALGRIGDEPDSGSILRELMADGDSRVRGAAMRALVQLKKRNAVPVNVATDSARIPEEIRQV
jgi:hypothetical protein